MQAVQGFNVIATANDRDRGVNDLSSALKRRFNTVVLPLPASADEEVRIVSKRVAEMGSALALPVETPALDEIRRVVTIFRELRSGFDHRRQIAPQITVEHTPAQPRRSRRQQRVGAGRSFW